MRLMFYTHGLVGGGAERVWATLATGMRGRGHEVGFVVDYEADANRHLVRADIPMMVLGGGHGTTVWRLARHLDREKPQVLLAAVGASNPKALAARLMSRWRGALVLSQHGRLDAEYGILGRGSYMATALTSRITDLTLAASHDLRDYLVARFHADPKRTLALPNAILLPDRAVVPSRETLAARADHVVAMGRLVPEKGMASLIEAVARATRQPRLTILGEGPERARLEALIQRLGVGDRVALAGYVKVPGPMLEQAKMLALASTTEAFGNVVVEALGHGLPVVATRCGGPAEILGENVHGRLTPVGDIPALAAAIDATLADPGDPARHRARAEDFSSERAFDRLEAMLADLPRARGG